MAESTSKILRYWEKKIEDSDGKVEITVDEDFRSLSADIISRACFGRSYEQGEKIFSKLQSLQRIMSKGTIGVPGMRYHYIGFNHQLDNPASDFSYEISLDFVIVFPLLLSLSLVPV